jgi:hypothetical protein
MPPFKLAWPIDLTLRIDLEGLTKSLNGLDISNLCIPNHSIVQFEDTNNDGKVFKMTQEISIDFDARNRINHYRFKSLVVLQAGDVIVRNSSPEDASKDLCFCNDHECRESRKVALGFDFVAYISANKDLQKFSKNLFTAPESVKILVVVGNTFVEQNFHGVSKSDQKL